LHSRQDPGDMVERRNASAICSEEARDCWRERER
jgi:hypothetical protein